MRLADAVDGVVRDGEFAAIGFMPARRQGMLVPVSAARNLAGLSPDVTAVITTAELAAEIPSHIALAINESPLEIFWNLHEKLDEREFYWKDFPSEIHETALVSPQAFIAPNNVRIGANCVVEPNVTILERVIIGNNCVIRAGAVVGTEGFEVRSFRGRNTVIKHTGGVRLHDNVQIMANTCICKALMGGWTEIGEDTVVDNLVHIAHDVQIGARCKIVAHAMLGGSLVIGDDSWVGPNATVSNSLRLGPEARVSLGAVVTRDVPTAGHVTGNFAVDHNQFIENIRKDRR